MKKLILAALAFAISMNANAAYECSVKVANVLIYSEGSVNVLHSGRGDYTVVCNLNADRAGVSPTTCAMWAGMLQAIKKKNGLAQFYFNGEGTCATLPVYGSAPAPVYIGDVSP
ncbi:MAG: hypothetical protein WKG03_03260 [Telluria sp.]